MSSCKAIIQEGPRKGNGCLFPPEDDGYCGRHKRNKEYDLLISSGHKPCRLFFRGCNELITDGKNVSCNSCRGKLRKHTTLCSHKGCVSSAKDNGYCGRHIRDELRDKEKELGIKYCDIARGCFNLCKTGYSTCESCLEKTRLMENIQYEKRKLASFTEQLSDTKKLICCYCGSDFPYSLSRYNKPFSSCEKCRAIQVKIDLKRADRVRNFSEEKFRNIERLYTEYLRNAKTRGIAFELTKSQVEEIVKKPCHYCNGFIEGEAVGIDRVDNNGIYKSDNVVPACRLCNKMKYTFPKEFFISHCMCIAKGEWDSELMGQWSVYYEHRLVKYNTYVRSADLLSREWTISEDEYYSTRQKACYVCGYDKAPVGIDRFNSNIGYTSDNIRPCCYPCNMMKSDMDYNDFITHISFIVSANSDETA